MGPTLIIDVTDASGWMARSPVGASWRPGQPLPADSRVVAVAPAQAVTLHRVEVPARRGAELRQAVPFALEDRLAEPVEALHFALGRRTGTAVEAAVVARSAIAAWLERLADAGLTPDSLRVDAQLLPRDDRSIHLVRVDSRLLLATGELACAIGFEDWPQWRRRLPPLPLFWLAADGRFQEGEAPPALARVDFLRYAATRVAAADGPDLLQAEFAPRRRAASRRRQWRWAAGLAGLAVILALADAGAGVLKEQQRRQALRDQIETVFRQALPDQRMTADPAAQFASELARQRRTGGAGGGPFALLKAAAPLVTQGSLYRLASVDYRLGILEMEVDASDVSSLDRLREAMAGTGLAVEVTGVSPQDDGVRGRLRLRGSGT